MFGAQLGKLGRKDESRANGCGPRAGGVAVSSQFRSKLGYFITWHVERQPAVESGMPTEMSVVLVRVRATRLDERRPTGCRLPDCREHGKQAVFEPTQALLRLMKFL